MTDYDSPWKEAMDAYFEPFMAFFFPESHKEIDWSRGYESLDKELQQVVREADIGRRFVDKLVKVYLQNSEERWLLIHVEVQGTEEVGFPRRMYVYNYRIFDRYNTEVVSLAILADENPAWRPAEYAYGLWGFQVGIRFPVVKLLDYARREEELGSSPNPFALVVLAHLKTQETRRDASARRAWKVQLIEALYRRGADAEEIQNLFRFIDWMMELPKDLDQEFYEEIRRYEEENRMPFITTPERIGREKGLAQGLREGRLEGIQLALKLKFGEAGLQLMPEITKIEDPGALEKVFRAIETAATPEHLRQIWTVTVPFAI